MFNYNKAISEDEEDKMSSILYSDDIDNKLLGLYMVKGMLTEKQFISFFTDYNYAIGRGFTVWVNRNIIKKCIEENPSLPELNLFYWDSEINEETIRLMISYASCKSDGDYYYGYYRAQYLDKAIEYISENGFKLYRSDVFALSTIMTVRDFLIIFDSCDLKNILKDSDYFKIFKKCGPGIGSRWFSVNEEVKKYVLTKLVNHFIDKNISNISLWDKLLKEFVDPCEIDDFLIELKYSKMSRKLLKLVIGYSNKYRKKQEKQIRKSIWFELRNYSIIKKYNGPKKYSMYLK